MKVMHCPHCKGRGEFRGQSVPVHDKETGLYLYTKPKHFGKCEACKGTGRIKTTKPKTSKT